MSYNYYRKVGYPTKNTMKKDKEYTAKLDSKKRVVIRGAKYDYYEVSEYPNGKIVLQPRILLDPQLKHADKENVVE